MTMTHDKAIATLKRYAKTLVDFHEGPSNDGRTVVGFIMSGGPGENSDFFDAMKSLKKRPSRAAAQAKKSRKNQPPRHSGRRDVNLATGNAVAPDHLESFEVTSGSVIDLRIPNSGWSLEQFTQNEGLLNNRLMRANLGKVSQRIPANEKEADFYGVLINVTALESALKILREELDLLDAPVGTKLLYADGKGKWCDELREEGWDDRLPHT